MSIEMLQYIETNSLGIVVLLVMLVSIVSLHHDTRQKDQRYFTEMLICNAVILVMDTVITLLKGYRADGVLVLHHIACVLYFAGHGYFGYLWLKYCIYKLFPEYIPGRKRKLLLALPCLLNCLLVAVSPWTGWVYHVDGINGYQRGDGLMLMMALSFLYWIISMVLVIREILHPTKLRERSVYFTLMIFPVPTLVGIAIQMVVYGLSVIWVCSAVSLMILFLNLQNYQISRDILTGLFNRRQTNKQLGWELAHIAKADYRMFVIMIDVDHFKSINDQYGHLLGDEALIWVARILKRGSRERDFVGRFGGDEFIVIGHVWEEQEVAVLLEKIGQETERVNREENLPYSLSLSTGCAVYGKRDLLTVDKIISAADKEMYKTKAVRKAAVQQRR